MRPKGAAYQKEFDMPATYGYGVRTFVQGMALLACKLAKYSVKHNAKLQQYLPPAAYSCLTGAIGCLNSLCDLKNRSAA